MAMRQAFVATLIVASFTAAGSAVAVRAQAVHDDILPPSILFATSTGYWEDDGNSLAVERAPTTTQSVSTEDAKPQQRHGYYKLFAVRQPDKTSKVYLQQIAQSDIGPAIVSTAELQEISDLKPYVTDIRPENSSGFIKEPGFFATIYLKTDPAAEPDGWTVLIDEFGDITVEKATN
ncbi:hypothetical protein [Rhizobium sp. BK650]|uniref:hypothetical protein n=1 Tax=Rhizobium sp. BK650 TaxID=2586990 RepID=UPI00160C1534|nr:hypothetical protein [Rhizobium sp. BK650]